MTYYNPVCPKCGSDGVRMLLGPLGTMKSCLNCKHNWEDQPLELVPMEKP